MVPAEGRKAEVSLEPTCFKAFLMSSPSSTCLWFPREFMNNSEPIVRFEGIPDTYKTQTTGRFQNCARD